MPTYEFNLNEAWKDIEKEYAISKKGFGKKISFVRDQYKRKVIFRDVAQAYILSISGFNKPAIIIAGSILEELLRLYLESRGPSISNANKNFNGYITLCEQNGLLKVGISRLTDSVRHFRNLVHMAEEKSPRETISKAAAKGAISSIFTIANDFLK